jgi:hypothetical protein
MKNLGPGTGTLAKWHGSATLVISYLFITRVGADIVFFIVDDVFVNSYKKVIKKMTIFHSNWSDPD